MEFSIVIKVAIPIDVNDVNDINDVNDVNGSGQAEFNGNKPCQKKTVLAGLRSGKVSRYNWQENERFVDVFDAKRDVIQSLVEIGFNQNKIYVDDKAPSYFHPGKSGSIYLNENENNPVAYFGEVHPNI